MTDSHTTGTGFDRRAIPPHAHESVWTAPDGHRLRRIDWPGGSDGGDGGGTWGSLLFLPGRGDFYEKYLETLDHWHRRGWHVTAADWRWQAGSGRYGRDPLIGDIGGFATWIDDLAALWRDWTRATPPPHVLAGHSMGGHLVLRALAERRVDPAALVLSAPMLGLVTPLPRVVQPLFGRLMCRIGDPARPAWKASEKPLASVKGRQDLLTHHDARYADEQWWRAQRPALAMGPASWRWVAQAAASIARLDAPGVLEGVAVPVLLLGARHDGLVAWSAIARAARRLPRAELVGFGREAAHELLREADPVRQRVLAAIDSFLDRAAPPAHG